MKQNHIFPYIQNISGRSGIRRKVMGMKVVEEEISFLLMKIENRLGTLVSSYQSMTSSLLSS